MTDNEIIKALECCSKSDTEDNYCDGCPYEKEKYCASKISKDSLDLINRLQAELERLTKETMNMAITIESCQGEAITEFAERLKEGAQMADCFDSYNMVVGTHFINDLLKEMIDE